MSFGTLAFGKLWFPRDRFNPLAFGSGLLAQMAKTGVWNDTKNGFTLIWDDRDVWNDGVDNNFTTSALDTNADPGDLCGTIAPLPDGGAVTYTLADDFGDAFAIVGNTIVLATSDPNAGIYSLTANAINVSGWTWAVPCLVRITQAEIVLPLASFSKQTQIGVPLSGVVVPDIPDEITVVSNIPGVTVDNSVRPVVATGTPTVNGDIASGLVTVLGEETRANTITVLAGAPEAFSVLPSQSGPASVGQAQVCDPGAAPGAGSVPSYRWYYRPGTTGSGSPVDLSYPGSFSNTIIPAASGGQYSCRVRWFRGVLYIEGFTPWSATIADAVATVPEFTGPSSYSGGGEIGDIQTVVPGTGTGTVSVYWTTNNVPNGATGLTYQLQHSDRMKGVLPVISRTIGDITVVDTTPLLSTLCYPKLSKAYHGGAAWYDDFTIQRHQPKALIAVAEPGRNGWPIVANVYSQRSRTIPIQQDVYMRGGVHFSTAEARGYNIQMKGARNVVVTADDTGGYKWQWDNAAGDVHFIGVFGDFGLSYPQDGFYHSGSAGTQRTFHQGCRLINMNGTDRDCYILPNSYSSGWNEAPIELYERISPDRVRLVLGTLPAGFRPPTIPANPLDPKQRTYGMVRNAMVSPGVITRQNVDWNTRLEFISWDPPTKTLIAIPAIVADGGTFAPSVGSSAVANTGLLAVTKRDVLGQHTDFAMGGPDDVSEWYGHNNHIIGNYTIRGIKGSGRLTISNEVWEIWEDFEGPQEYKAPSFQIGPSAGSAHPHEFTNVYQKNLRVGESLSGKLQPYNATEAVVTLPNGNQFLPISTTFQGRGGLELGEPVGGTFAPARATWNNYTTNFWGQRNPVNADMTSITLSNASIAASSPQGTEIGWMDVVHTLPGADSAGRYPILVDLVISGPNASKVQTGQYPAMLQKGAGAWTAGVPFTIQITATVRDSAANYGTAVTHGPVTITVSPV